jgi:hypothetical protein
MFAEISAFAITAATFASVAQPTDRFVICPGNARCPERPPAEPVFRGRTTRQTRSGGQVERVARPAPSPLVPVGGDGIRLTMQVEPSEAASIFHPDCAGSFSYPAALVRIGYERLSARVELSGSTAVGVAVVEPGGAWRCFSIAGALGEVRSAVIERPQAGEYQIFPLVPAGQSAEVSIRVTSE